MKKVLQTVLVFAVIFLIWGTASYIEQNYSRDCVVYEINGDTITAEDNTGNLWDFEADGSQFKVGEAIILKMNTKCTDSYIYDDEITGWKKGR